MRGIRDISLDFVILIISLKQMNTSLRKTYALISTSDVSTSLSTMQVRPKEKLPGF